MAPAGDDSSVAAQLAGAVHYEIRIEGLLDQRWSAWFDGLQIASQPGGVTVIAGPVTDQAALHGLLAKVHDLGLPLISVRRIGPTPGEGDDHGPDTNAHGEHDRE
jgi:hypothetical protein